MKNIVTKIIQLLRLNKQQELSDAILQERITKILNDYKEEIKKEIRNG